jgi:hypothetical protein
MADRSEVLPRMDEIVKIIVSNEQNVPGNCLECRFSDGDLFGEWFCVTNRKIDFLMARPDWCPIMVRGSMAELLFTFRNLSDNEKRRVAEKKKKKVERRKLKGRTNDKNEN